MSAIKILTDVLINFSYLLFCIFLIAFFGNYFYKKLFLTNISLREKLFRNDSLAIWIDFIGGFIAPVFFLISTLIAPNGKFVYQGTFYDFLIAFVYIAIYILVFSFLKLLANYLISVIGKFKYKRPYSLKDEIFNNDKITPSLFSIAISFSIVGIMLQENFAFENPLPNIIRMLFVLLISIGVISVYTRFVFPKRTSLYKEVLMDNNVSSGILLIGNTITINMLIYSCIVFIKPLLFSWTNILNVFDVLLLITYFYLIIMVVVAITKKVLEFIAKVDIESEIFEQNNLGYALFESTLYIMLAHILINSFLIR